LGLLGQFQVLDGDLESGEKNLDEAVRLWESNRRANVWENPKIAKSLILALHGNYEKASVMLQEVIVAARETGNIMSQLWAEVRLGYVALQAGHLMEARELFGKTAEGFARDSNAIGVVFALEGMAGFYLSVENFEYAARLIGWADAERVRIRDPRPNLEQADVDKIIAACLTKIGDELFADAYEEGQAMSLAEAIGYSLQERG
jgi:tetratricopeptide (TPR) repeat protein